MVKATWNGVVVAESDATVQVEGNHYFPADSIKSEHFKENASTTVCGWKGTANYYDVVVNDSINAKAAFYYADAKPAAANIKGFVAFWKGVKVE
jgi:uncharacterized protein (DUF427 family)